MKTRPLHILARAVKVPRRAFSVVSQSVGQFRMNAATGDWVCFNTSRAGRPNQFEPFIEHPKTTTLPTYVDTCPFCNEDLTGPSLLTLEDPDREAHWGTRVVANKYPSVASIRGKISPEMMARGLGHIRQEFRNSKVLNKSFPAVGDHEVVIETPFHNRILSRDKPQRTERLIQAWLQRATHMRQKVSTRQILYFKNQGATGGASILHPHAQIVGLPVVPQLVAKNQRRAFEWFIEHGTCVFTQTIDEELNLFNSSSDVSRVVEVNDHFLAYVPFAALSPFNCWIVPLMPNAHFEDISTAEVESMKKILHATLRRLNIALDEPDYNIVVKSAPLKGRGWQQAYNPSTFFRWHVVITPRWGAGEMAGFEYASGIYSNSTLPEEDARTLREQSIDDQV